MNGNGNQNGNQGKNDDASRERRMDCAEIQTVLLDYMTRELGQSRSDLVRSHLRKCPECRKAAADMQSTIDLLQAADGEGVPSTLSDEHRKRMFRALTHPILDWMTRHHVVTSLAIALVVLSLVLLVLWRTRWLERGRPEEEHTVIYRGSAEGALQFLATNWPPDKAQAPQDEGGEP